MSVALFDVLTIDTVELSSTTNAGWLDVDDTYAVVGNPNANQVEGQIDTIRDAGKYMVGMSSTYNITSVGNSVQMRFRLNGGAWEDFSRESTDTTDRLSMDYLFPFQHAGGAFSMDVQIKKENNNNTLQVYFLNVWFQRVA